MLDLMKNKRSFLKKIRGFGLRRCKSIEDDVIEFKPTRKFLNINRRWSKATAFKTSNYIVRLTPSAEGNTYVYKIVKEYDCGEKEDLLDYTDPDEMFRALAELYISRGYLISSANDFTDEKEFTVGYFRDIDVNVYGDRF